MKLGERPMNGEKVICDIIDLAEELSYVMVAILLAIVNHTKQTNSNLTELYPSISGVRHRIRELKAARSSEEKIQTLVVFIDEAIDLLTMALEYAEENDILFPPDVVSLIDKAVKLLEEHLQHHLQHQKTQQNTDQKRLYSKPYLFNLECKRYWCSQ